MRKAINMKNVVVAVGLSAAFVTAAVLAFAFLIIMLILAVLGFAGFGAAVSTVAKIVLLVLVILSVLFLAPGQRRGVRPGSR